MKLPALPLAALALLLAQCRHAEPAPAAPVNPLALLPVESQTGAGTFGCLINGKAYLTYYAGGAHADYTYYPRLAVLGSLYENGSTSLSGGGMYFVLNGDFRTSNPSVFELTTLFANNANQFTASSTTPASCYYSGQYIKRGGEVVITNFDGPNKIISGRFAFTLYEPGGCDTLRVTDGRFDVKF